MGGSFILQKAKNFCTSDGTIVLSAPSPLRIVRWRRRQQRKREKHGRRWRRCRSDGARSQRWDVKNLTVQGEKEKKELKQMIDGDIEQQRACKRLIKVSLCIANDKQCVINFSTSLYTESINKNTHVMQALKCIVDSKIHQQTWKWIYISRQRICL